MSMRLLVILAHLFYSNECCADKHCRPIPCEEIIHEDDNWHWRGYVFTHTMLHDSPDGACHICISPQPLCIYLPPRV